MGKKQKRKSENMKNGTSGKAKQKCEVENKMSKIKQKKGK